MNFGIDEEWKKFLSSGCDDEDDEISDFEIDDLNSFIKKDEDNISNNLLFDFVTCPHKTEFGSI